MSGTLPDLDEAISFTVDDGAQAGPFTMRTIIDSIRQGSRAPTSLVWWAGEPEWIAFSSIPGLMNLLQDLPATNQPPPPGADSVAPAESNGAAGTDPEAEAVVDDPADASTADEPTIDEAAASGTANTDEANAEDSAALEAEGEAEADSSDWFDEVMGSANDATADVVTGGILGQSSDADQQIDSAEVEWTDDSDLIESTSAQIADVTPDTFSEPEVVEVEVEVEVEVDTDHTVEVDTGDSVREAVEQLDPRLGLFGAGAGTAKMDPTSNDSSAERRDVRGDVDAPVEEDPHLALVADSPLQAVPDPDPGRGVEVDVGIAAVETSVPDLGADELEEHFAELLRVSGEHHRRLEWADGVADVLHGALITSALDNGFVLIDQTTEGAKHFVRFEDPADLTRLTMAIEQVARPGEHVDISTHLASVAIGWGQRVADPSGTLAAIEAEANESTPTSSIPGTVGVDSDVSSGHAYTTVELIFAIDDFVAADYSIDRPALSRTVSSSVHSLRKYWSGRFTPSSS